MRSICLISLLFALTFHAVAQGSVSRSVREYREVNEHQILKEFFQLLSIPNVASDTENIDRNAEYLLEELKKRDLDPRLLRAENSTVPPVVYGEWKVPGAVKTIIFYAHYDGQPTDPKVW
ncbi:MAG: peptidase M20, partial [Acidobacteria bacterium]|nr:peptidase M20 [Acidobacteriota bacterium]